MQVYYDKDADLSLIQSKTVAILGYGSQGHAHANNLKDSGVKVVVGLRKGSTSWAKAESAGLTVAEINTAVASADLVMLLAPDEHQAALYRQIEGDLKQGATLAFAHGFNIHYGQVVPRADLDVAHGQAGRGGEGQRGGQGARLVRGDARKDGARRGDGASRSQARQGAQASGCGRLVVRFSASASSPSGLMSLSIASGTPSEYK